MFNPSNKQIRALLQSEKGSDFAYLVEQNASVNTGEIYPTNNVPVLVPDGGIMVMRWGFSRFDGKGVIINARSETAASKPIFARPMVVGRCLVPASWYFEWENRG